MLKTEIKQQFNTNGLLALHHCKTYGDSPKYPLISYPSEVLWMTSDIKTYAHLVEHRKAWVECSTHSWLLVSHLIWFDEIVPICCALVSSRWGGMVLLAKAWASTSPARGGGAFQNFFQRWSSWCVDKCPACALPLERHFAMKSIQSQKRMHHRHVTMYQFWSVYSWGSGIGRSCINRINQPLVEPNMICRFTYVLSMSSKAALMILSVTLSRLDVMLDSANNLDFHCCPLLQRLQRDIAIHWHSITTAQKKRYPLLIGIG